MKKFSKFALGLAVFGLGGVAMAQSLPQTPADILTSVDTTLTAVKVACVGAAIFFTGFKVVKWFRR